MRLYYSTQWQVLEERENAATTAKRQNVWSPVYVDAMVLRDRDVDGSTANGLEERLYVQQDANYNVTSLLDTSGNVVERYVYNPYGEPTVLNPDWSIDTLLGSDGTTADDAGLKLSHFRFRDLHLELGRWTRQDPKQYVDGMNHLLSHVSNPLRFVDPLGLSIGDRVATEDDLGKVITDGEGGVTVAINEDHPDIQIPGVKEVVEEHERVHVED